MAAQFPNGTIFSISTGYGTAKVVTAVTNANPGVATSTAHGFTDGDILLLTAASTVLDQRVVRVDNSSTNAFDLEGIDTTSTSIYPSGFGVGSALDVSTWVPLSQTVGVTSSGGEQQYATWKYVETGKEYRRKTFKNARGIEFQSHYDPSLAWHSALLTADLDGSTRILRAALPGGDTLYWSVEVAYDGQPSITIDENMGVTIGFSLINQTMTRYGA